MAETDLTAALADALSGTSDTGTAMTYETIGDSTYYTESYRLRQRLLTMARMPGNSLRVYKDGDLTCGVRAGKVAVGMSTFDFAGKATKSINDNATNRIYLTSANLSSGDDCSVSTDSWATLIATGDIIIPLAEIATGTESTSGTNFDYRDITDYRGRLLLKPPGLDAKVVEESTVGSGAPNVLLAAETGKVLTNQGSAATNYHTLPTCAAGLTFTFIDADSSDLMRIVAGASDKIVIAGTATKAAGYVESTAQWDSIVLVGIDEEYWFAVAVNGTWTVETS